MLDEKNQYEIMRLSSEFIENINQHIKKFLTGKIITLIKKELLLQYAHNDHVVLFSTKRKAQRFIDALNSIKVANKLISDFS